jgi:Ca-activated chloride channel family protein
MQFEFENSYYFLLTLAIFCIYLCPIKATKRYFVHLKLFSVSKGFFDKEKFLVALSLFFMIVALASPIWYEQKSPNKKKGRDLVLVLDTSGSMSQSGFDKENKTKSKFDSVIEILKDFIKQRGDDNIGVVVFGTYAFASSALTYDMNALSFMLRYIEPSIAGENTAIGDGLHAAIELFKNSNAKQKVILLLSDGYQNSGSFSIKEQVSKAKDKGIKIYTIGIGKSKDFDQKLLEKIATQTNAKFFSAKDKKELKKVYNELNKLEPSPIKSMRYLNKIELFDLPLFFSMLILFYLLTNRRKKHLGLYV